MLSGAVKFDGFSGDGGATGGGPVAWIARAFVPESGGGARRRRRGCSTATGRGSRSPSGTRTWPPTTLPARTPHPRRRHRPRAPAPLPDPPGAPPAAAPAPAVGALSYSSLAEYARCGYRFYAERVLGLPAAPAPRPAPDGRGAPAGPRSAADRGVLLHALLERLDFRRPAVPTAEAIVAAAAAAGLSPPPGPAESDELAALVRRFIDSPLCERLGRATDARREERFSFPAPGGIPVVGAIDVLAREPGGRVLIVDYKSDRIDASAPGRDRRLRVRRPAPDLRPGRAARRRRGRRGRLLLPRGARPAGPRRLRARPRSRARGPAGRAQPRRAGPGVRRDPGSATRECAPGARPRAACAHGHGR